MSDILQPSRRISTQSEWSTEARSAHIPHLRFIVDDVHGARGFHPPRLTIRRIAEGLLIRKEAPTSVTLAALAGSRENIEPAPASLKCFSS